eukprot:354396-Chlamydomonas_euryale.AAC.2
MERWMDEWMDGKMINGWVHGWMDGHRMLHGVLWRGSAAATRCEAHATLSRVSRMHRHHMHVHASEPYMHHGTHTYVP